MSKIHHGQVLRGRNSLRGRWWKTGRVFISSACISLITATTGPALGQQIAIEEIVVTARRIAENLQDVPLQVTAFSTEMLRQAVTQDMRDLNFLAPGMNYQGQLGREGTGRLFFRGLHSGTSTAASSTKGSAFLDGSYYFTNGQDIPFDYFERIEVMPGPQAALFGRATFGGAINFITKDPTDEFSARIAANIGSTGTQNLSAYIAGPILGNDRILASLMVAHHNWGGPEMYRTPPDIRNPRGIAMQATQTNFAALKLVFEATENLRIEAHLMTNYDADGPFGFFRSRVARRNGQFTLPNGTFITYPVGTIKIKEEYGGPVGGLSLNWETYTEADPTRRTRSMRPNIHIEYEAGDHLIQAIYFHEHESWKQGVRDFDFSVLPFNHALNNKQTRNGNSAEIIVFSPQEQRFRYKFGAYYLKNSNTRTRSFISRFSCRTEPQGPADVGANFLGCDLQDPAGYFQPIFTPFVAGGNVGTLFGYSGTFRTSSFLSFTDDNNGVENKSAFFGTSFDFTDRVTLDVEARYQRDTITFINNLAGSFFQDTFKALLPRINLQYKFNEGESMFYVLFALGNNPGGFNTSNFIGDPGTGTTEAEHRLVPEEKLFNYEIGMKARWFDGSLITNLTAYHMNWDDMTNSVAFPNPATGSSFNLRLSLGASRVRGLAAEITAAPTEKLSIRATASFNDSVYTTWCSRNLWLLVGISSPNRLNCIEVKGNKLENVPPWTASLNVDYVEPLTGPWSFRINVTGQYSDGMFASDMNFMQMENSYLINGNAGFETDNFSIQAYCANCTQEVAPYRIVRLSDNRAGPTGLRNNSFTGSPRRPRVIGVRTVWTF